MGEHTNRTDGDVGMWVNIQTELTGMWVHKQTELTGMWVQ